MRKSVKLNSAFGEGTISAVVPGEVKLDAGTGLAFFVVAEEDLS